MTRIVIKLMILPMLLFTAVIGLIRAQPYDDHGLQTLLALDNDCATPCFLGIQPGVTRIDESFSRLEESAWIDDFEVVYGNTQASTGYINIHWEWSGQQPVFINEGVDGQMTVSSDGIVMSIVITTHTRLADWFMYQRPDVLVSMSGRDDVLHMAGYAHQQILIFTNVAECVSPPQQLHSDVGVELGWLMPRNTALVLNLLEHPTLYDLEFCQ